MNENAASGGGRGAALFGVLSSSEKRKKPSSVSPPPTRDVVAAGNEANSVPLSLAPSLHRWPPTEPTIQLTVRQKWPRGIEGGGDLCSRCVIVQYFNKSRWGRKIGIFVPIEGNATLATWRVLL